MPAIEKSELLHVFTHDLSVLLVRGPVRAGLAVGGHAPGLPELLPRVLDAEEARQALALLGLAQMAKMVRVVLEQAHEPRVLRG